MAERGSGKPGTSRHRGRGIKPAGRGRSGPVPVRSSSTDDMSESRRHVKVVRRVRGLALRWKIVISIVAVLLVTAILIFVIVYPKAVDQLNTEINAKGHELVEILGSIDHEYWYTTIHSGKGLREEELNNLITALTEKSLKDWQPMLNQAAVQKAYSLIVDPFSDVREGEFGVLLTTIAGNQRWKGALENNADLRRQFDHFVRPFPGLDKLNPLMHNEIRREDLLDSGVADVAEGNSSAPAISIGGRITITLPEGTTKVGSVLVVDRARQQAGRTIPSRWFVKEVEEGGRHLKFYANLSMESIDAAKSQLMTAILLPILLTGLLGVGTAIWVSTLITNPLKVLMGDINAVSGGDLEHQTVPQSRDEIGELAVTFDRMTQALRAAREQELEQKALEHELNIANEIQANLLPKRMLKVPGYDVGAYYRPSKEVGGDYYDFIQISEENIGIIVADVSGKGVPGSLVMSMARAFVRMEAERSRNVSASDTLIRANRMLAQDIKKGMFVTALYCILNIRTRELSVASAGHNPLVLWRAEENKIHLVNPAGIALGFDKGPVFERTIKEDQIVLAPNDRIVLYTDGTVEAMNENNEEFGDEKFYSACKQLATRESNEFINILIRALDQHQGEAPQHDDMTLVTLRVTG